MSCDKCQVSVLSSISDMPKRALQCQAKYHSLAERVLEIEQQILNIKETFHAKTNCYFYKTNKGYSYDLNVWVPPQIWQIFLADVLVAEATQLWNERKCLLRKMQRLSRRHKRLVGTYLGFRHFRLT